MGRIKSETPPLGIKVMKRLEQIRKERNLSVANFVKHFAIKPSMYYQALNFANGKGAEKRISLERLEKGLDSLEYDAHIIFMDRREK